MSIFLNLGSLILGLVSWLIPLLAVNRRRKGQTPVFCFIYSFTACAAALVLQLYEVKHRVALEDFSAIMDTIGAVSAVSVLLVVITLALNLVAAHLYRREGR